VQNDFRKTLIFADAHGFVANLPDVETSVFKVQMPAFAGKDEGVFCPRRRTFALRSTGFQTYVPMHEPLYVTKPMRTQITYETKIKYGNKLIIFCVTSVISRSFTGQPRNIADFSIAILRPMATHDILVTRLT
jgi:hypothetical protein